MPIPPSSIPTAGSSRATVTPYPGIPVRVIPRRDAGSRNTRKGTNIVVHSSQQREERTKKRRRCYRAESVDRAESVAGGAIVGGCGTRCELRQSSPRSLLRLALSRPDKGGVYGLPLCSGCKAPSSPGWTPHHGGGHE